MLTGPEHQLKFREVLQKRLKDFPTRLVIENVRRRLDVEGYSCDFSMRTSEFNIGTENLSDDNALMFEFPTLREIYPELYTAPVYRISVVFAQSVPDLNPASINELTKKMTDRNIDRTLIWLTTPIDHSTTSILKALNVQVIYTSATEFTAVEVCSNFIIHKSEDVSTTLVANVIGEVLITRLKKVFHMVLSEIAAPIYDRHYGHAPVGTRQMMAWEEKYIDRIVAPFREAKRQQSDRKTSAEPVYALDEVVEPGGMLLLYRTLLTGSMRSTSQKG